MPRSAPRKPIPANRKVAVSRGGHEFAKRPARAYQRHRFAEVVTKRSNRPRVLVRRLPHDRESEPGEGDRDRREEETGPDVPPSLRDQLKVGGRLVVPIGETVGLQKLVRVTRTGADSYDTEDLGAVRFVPLIGAEGWREPEGPVARPPRELPLARSIAGGAVPFERIDDAPLDGLLERIGAAQVVLLGSASHGSSEFYKMRARITRELITRKGFNIVAVEADWPDAARIDHYVRDLEVSPPDWQALARDETGDRSRERRFSGSAFSGETSIGPSQ